jgi:hypothetical protein
MPLCARSPAGTGRLAKGGNMTARKAALLLIPTALGAMAAWGWPDISRYLKIKQMSYGNGHPENVPVRGRESYPHPSSQTREERQGQSGRPVGETSAHDWTGVDPQEPIDERSPDLQARS